MSETDQISEAPAEESGAEETNNANLSIEELASSFVEKVESEAEESEPEAPEEEAEAGEDEESDVLSQSIEEEDESDQVLEDQPKSVQKLLKQVSRLTARSKGAEEEVAALKDQIESIKSQPSKPTTQDNAKPTLEKVQTIQELNDLRKEAMAAKKWALGHIGNDYVEVDGKEFSDEDIRNILMEAEEYLGEKIPERANFLQEKQNWQQETVTTFPWTQQGEGPEWELFLQLREGAQYKTLLDGLPNGDFVAGVMVEGINSIKARQAKPKAKSKKVASPPPIDAGDAVAPPAKNKEQRLAKKKQAILSRKGNLTEQDFAQYLNL